ncbi:MAG: SWIM zinc finger family protein [Chloroflexi bacterium]|nr:SWIM zinc finger family protein [Chloroflexota bacterium]
MNTLPKFSEDVLHHYANEKSIQRGREYYEGGAVLSVVLRGSQLFAKVIGSEEEPYQVRVELNRHGLVGAACSCPYDWDGYCKHIVAVILAYIHGDKEIDERPTVEELISDIGERELKTLVERLVRERPELANLIDDYCASLHPA